MLAWFEGSVEICCLECKALGEVGGMFCHTEKGQLWPPISPQPERNSYGTHILRDLVQLAIRFMS